MYFYCPPVLQTWLDKLRLYFNPKALMMLVLGFSAGLPLMLVFGTLSFWLREAGIERSTITFLSWVALAYAFKWIWSPLIDRINLPLLGRKLGRRRSWMLLAQLGVVAGLLGIATSDPQLNLGWMVAMAMLVAFSSATQDISIDAFRIESAETRFQAVLASTYMLGYRVAMIAATTGALFIAAWSSADPEAYSLKSWQIAYTSMAALMIPGILAVFFSPEPEVKESTGLAEKRAQLESFLDKTAHLPRPLAHLIGWFYIAVQQPVADFIRRYGRPALMLLTLIACYRISDVMMGSIANVFYVDMGFSKTEIAEITKLFGIGMTILGALLGGALVYRFGVLKILLLGAVLAASSNLLFAMLSLAGRDLMFLVLTISLDNLSAGIATAAFIAFLSGLTSASYTATQYAIFSSVMLLLPKFLAGFSGTLVDQYGYAEFFIGTALLGIPVILLVIRLIGSRVLDKDLQ